MNKDSYVGCHCPCFKGSPILALLCGGKTLTLHRFIHQPSLLAHGNGRISTKRHQLLLTSYRKGPEKKRKSDSSTDQQIWLEENAEEQQNASALKLHLWQLTLNV
jgi:hypothetical protein